MPTVADALREINERPMFYDRAGNPITMGRWIDLFHDWSYRRVAFTVIAGVWHVSTVWMGNDMGFIGPPIIFETMVFENAVSHGYVGPSQWNPDGFGYSFHASIGEFDSRYSTEGQAHEGHAAIVAAARELFLPVLSHDRAAVPSCL